MSLNYKAFFIPSISPFRINSVANYKNTLVKEVCSSGINAELFEKNRSTDDYFSSGEKKKKKKRSLREVRRSLNTF